MSYVYDTMRRVWDVEIVPKLDDDELAFRFGAVIDAMHSANHRLDDGMRWEVAGPNPVLRGGDRRAHDAGAESLDRGGDPGVDGFRGWVVGQRVASGAGGGAPAAYAPGTLDRTRGRGGTGWGGGERRPRHRAPHPGPVRWRCGVEGGV